MREQPLNDEKPHPVLAALPVFAPDAALWSRIAAAHEKRHAVRRPKRWLAVAAAAAVAGAAIVALPRLIATQTGTPVAIDGPRESQALESEWRSLTAVSARPSVDLARLRIIDAALQAAYDRGAGTDELAPLWKQRNEALRGLILTAQADTVTRI
jgi:phosphoribosylcarboxyaminoimidazole (NCAIR) mutase